MYCPIFVGFFFTNSVRLHKRAAALNVMATLAMEREVDCSMEYAARCIYGALGASGPGEITKTFHVGAIARDVLLTLGDLDRRGPIWRVPVKWHVPNSNAFPRFRGFFELRRRSTHRLAIVLLGYYHPPFGAVGAVFDAVAGHRIANVTLSQLIDEIGDAILARERVDYPAAGEVSSGTLPLRS